jgi:hypothetical protein
MTSPVVAASLSPEPILRVGIVVEERRIELESEDPRHTRAVTTGEVPRE